MRLRKRCLASLLAGFLLTCAGLGFGLWQALGPEIEQAAMPSADGQAREQHPARTREHQPVAAA